MLTGETPPEPTVILNQGFPADRLLRHNVSPRVVDVIRKTMELAKVNRYQSVNEFLVALYGDNDVTVVNDVTSSHPDSTSDEPQQQPVFIADFSDEEPYPVTLDSLPDDAPSADTSDSVVNPQTPQSSVSPEPEVLPEDNKSGFPVWLIIIGVAVILGAVCFAYFSTDDTSPQSENVDTVSDVNSQTPPDKVTDMLWKSDVGDAKYSGSVMTVSRDGVNQTVPHGTGKAVFVTGINKGGTYEGDFVEGVIQGNGVFDFADGSRFAGEFDNNQFKKGRYTEKSSGKYYVGTFKNMQPDQGDWFNKDGQPI